MSQDIVREAYERGIHDGGRSTLFTLFCSSRLVKTNKPYSEMSDRNKRNIQAKIRELDVRTAESLKMDIPTLCILRAEMYRNDLDVSILPTPAWRPLVETVRHRLPPFPYIEIKTSATSDDPAERVRALSYLSSSSLEVFNSVLPASNPLHFHSDPSPYETGLSSRQKRSRRE